ncbi:MAG: DMT family transporter [Burkholderiaceae bacterium]
MSDLAPPAWLWIVCTVAAASVQTLRNAMQRSLTEQVGTVGATHVRFLFGLPFGLLFLGLIATFTDLSTLQRSADFFLWTAAGGVCQILATALMLAAMREHSFVVSIAYLKTEPVQIALFGLVFLGEWLSAGGIAAILLATVGVVLMSMPGVRPTPARLPRAALFGIAAGAMFALSAVGFRGAILALGDGPFHARASLTLVVALAIQTSLLSAWLLWRDRGVLAAIFRLWRSSLVAGFAGALASQMWFLAFALQSAAAVRTLGLIEILFAQAVSHKLFAQGTTRREAIGMTLMVAGLAWLMLAAS